jgi:hypothetical protein
MGQEAVSGRPTAVSDAPALDLVKCGMCGRATVIGMGQRHVCAACREAEQKLYARVRTLLREQMETSLTIQDVASMLNVEEKKITHLVDSGYFKLVMRQIRPYD